MFPIKDFTLTYEALNEKNTFSDGDTVTGTVTFTLKGETKVKSLFVKLKGDAHVRWSERNDDKAKTHRDHRRYFKVKEYLIAKNISGTLLPQGFHCFKFRLQIPHGDMPSSFQSSYGWIIYMLEAKLSRSWRWPTGEQKQLNFVSKSCAHPGQIIMRPQSGSLDKEIGFFSKGQVQMSATVDRKVCSPGDTLSVVAKICNSSSKKMRPKFSLQQKIVYRAHSATKVSDKSLGKMVWETIAVNSEVTVSCQLKIPDDIVHTLHNCDIITVDYYLKVYLDISFAFDPEVWFPLVIVPSSFAALHPGETLGPYPAGAVGAPSYSDFSPPALPIGPDLVPGGPNAYGCPGPDPTQPANTTSGYNNQWPQQAAPYGYPPAAFPPSSVQQQDPTAPPLFQQEQPPTYTSLFPPPQDPFSSLGSGQKN